MTWTIAASLAALSGGLLLFESKRHPLTLQLSFKGDVRRETAFLAQYGQSVATPIAGWLAAIALGGHDGPTQWRIFVLVCAPVIIVSLICTVLKHCLGRMRPNRENAGKFTGFKFGRDSKRESFPSSHSACAMSLSVVMIHLWPEAAAVFWTLAAICALLRYVTDAHFPSDVVAGTLIGLLVTQPCVELLEHALFPHGR